MLVGDVFYITNMSGQGDKYFILEDDAGKQYKCYLPASQLDKIYDYLNKPIKVAIINTRFAMGKESIYYYVSIVE